MNRLGAYIAIMLSMLFSNLHAQVLANFSANNISGCAPLAVQFQDLTLA
jgi:PKD repeat protein